MILLYVNNTIYGVIENDTNDCWNRSRYYLIKLHKYHVTYFMIGMPLPFSSCIYRTEWSGPAILEVEVTLQQRLQSYLYWNLKILTELFETIINWELKWKIKKAKKTKQTKKPQNVEWWNCKNLEWSTCYCVLRRS